MNNFSGENTVLIDRNISKCNTLGMPNQGRYIKYQSARSNFRATILKVTEKKLN